MPDHLRGSGRNSVSRVDSAGRPFSPRTGLIPTAANETVQLMTKPIDYEQIGMRTFYGALEGGGWHLGHLGLGKYKMDMLFLRQKGNALYCQRPDLADEEGMLGVLSAWHAVTLTPKAKADANIPQGAAFYAFAYPQKKYDRATAEKYWVHNAQLQAIRAATSERMSQAMAEGRASVRRGSGSCRLSIPDIAEASRREQRPPSNASLAMPA